MRIIDFEYNGERLSDYGLKPCYIDSVPDSVMDVANSVSINKVKAPNSQKYFSTGYTYDDVLTANFQACKIDCNGKQHYLSDHELNKIMRWLNRKKYCVFKPIYRDDYFTNVYFEGTFNVKPIIIGNGIVGIDLTLNTNAPYGFIETITYDYEFTSESDQLIIYDQSDEIGHLYCDVSITCLENGDLNISNSLDSDNNVVIHDCSEGEVITLMGHQKIIISSLASHTTLPNDFNYNFLRINNTYENNVNIFTSTLKCKVNIKYSPIRKVGLII